MSESTSTTARQKPSENPTSSKGKKSKTPPPGAKLTPMMERYIEVKHQYPDSLLLFRMGDFYELFYDDAEIAARVLGLTLTSRDKGSASPIAMAGFPFHALDNYLQKLIRAGHRAAICEQMEDPKQAKGLVKREVTRVVTPGTLTEDALLDPRTENFLAAVHVDRKQVGLAWLELSTGRFQVTSCPFDQLGDELARLRPAELLLQQGLEESPAFADLARIFDDAVVTERAPWCYVADTCLDRLKQHFGTNSLEGFDVEDSSPGVTAAGVLLDYVNETQKTPLGHISSLENYRSTHTVHIDEATRRSLELTQTLRGGHREGSLLHILDDTVTAMGARLLGEWIANPLRDLTTINQRGDAVQELTEDSTLLRELREELDGTYDLQRLAARVATGRCNPRDLVCLSRTLKLLPKTKSLLTGRKADRLCELEQRIDLCEDILALIEPCLVDEPPLNLTDGDLIRPGFNSRLDELRDLSRGGKEWIAAYQAKEIERTGISNLKVGFNKVFGYYLEVTAAHLQKVPDDYHRKQTLKNQERFITPELKEHEEKVLTADQQSLALETELFHELRTEVCQHVARLQKTAQILAELDVLACFAHTAVEHRYCRPELCEGAILDIREGRHPVLDQILPSGQFVPNDVLLGEAREHQECETEEETGSESPNLGHVQIITGPNMAGKSTYIRQAALLTLMAQTGSFVPAASARIGLVDRIFARVGASDELSKGQSTFMVEMTETARILNAATEQSLVILDEIGRGTSTYDGLSLAWAITEYLHDITKARTLFATHYHELTDLVETLRGVRNWTVAVHESDGDVIFLHKIVQGAADKSYGIHVARLAGVPGDVIVRANQILETLESDRRDDEGKANIPQRKTDRATQRQLNLFEPPPHPILEKLKSMDLDSLTPKAALDRLYELRGEL